MKISTLNPSGLNGILSGLLPDREQAAPGKIETLCEELKQHGCVSLPDVTNLLAGAHAGFQTLEKEWPPMEGSRYDRVGVTRLSLAIANRGYREGDANLDRSVPYGRYASPDLLPA